MRNSTKGNKAMSTGLTPEELIITRELIKHMDTKKPDLGQVEQLRQKIKEALEKNNPHKEGKGKHS
jgi:hypothetical protein